MPALKIFFEIIDALREGASPAQVAAGLTLGILLGMTPGWPLHIVLLLLVTLILNVNLAMASVGAALAVALAWLLDPAFHAVGSMLLESDSLKAIWTVMYNNPLVMLTRFNNSVILGAAVISLLAAAPLYFLFSFLLKRHQARLVKIFSDSRINSILQGSRFFKLYQHFRNSRA